MLANFNFKDIKPGTYLDIIYKKEEPLKKIGRGENGIQEYVYETAKSVVRIKIPTNSMYMIKNRDKNPNPVTKEREQVYEAVIVDGETTPFVRNIKTGEISLVYEPTFNRWHISPVSKRTYEMNGKVINIGDIADRRHKKSPSKFIIDAKKHTRVPYEIYSVKYESVDAAEAVRVALPDSDNYKVRYDVSPFMTFKLENIIKVYNKNKVFYEKAESK